LSPPLQCLLLADPPKRFLRGCRPNMSTLALLHPNNGPSSNHRQHGREHALVESWPLQSLQQSNPPAYLLAARWHAAIESLSPSAADA
jgi:hypothetical protein